MRRIHKLFINIFIIIVLLFVIGFSGGFYISQEQCILDSCRFLNVKERDIYLQFQNDNHYLSLVASPHSRKWSLIGTQKIGFLYKIAPGSSKNDIDNKYSIDVLSPNIEKMGMTIVIYRNNPEVDKVEINLKDGTTVILEEWNDDFTGILLDKEEYLEGVYKTYDKNNQLIEEIDELY